METERVYSEGCTEGDEEILCGVRPPAAARSLPAHLSVLGKQKSIGTWSRYWYLLLKARQSGLKWPVGPVCRLPPQEEDNGTRDTFRTLIRILTYILIRILTKIDLAS